MRTLITVSLVVLGLGVVHGCSCSDDTMGTDDIGTDDAAVTDDMDQFDLSGMVMPTDGGCSASGAACATSPECCSGVCSNNICVIGMCQPATGACTKSSDCCNLNCVNNACSAQQCVSDNQACTVGGNGCCSGSCVNNVCQPLNPSCKTAGNTCNTGGDCCSKTCTGGFCAAPSQISYCTQPGDICTHDAECCTGVCSGATASKPGICANISTGCTVDGILCSGCTGCCSSFCAPFGAGMTHICQPASGCHLAGDLCKSNSDCCGGDPSQIGTIPGAGLVKCVPVPGFPQIGTCSPPVASNCPAGQSCGNSCVPEGDACHFKNNGGCSVNAIRNDCCACVSSKDCCKLDKLGIPRCNAITTCVMLGGACADSADCCNNAPCVPDSMGHLKCGSMCVPQNGVCTTTSDCCTGLQCVVPPGSLAGTCGNPSFVPDGGLPDLAGADLAGADLAQPPPMCALFGQSCSTTTPCCTNEGTCLRPSPISTACAPGDTDCTCSSIIF